MLLPDWPSLSLTVSAPPAQLPFKALLPVPPVIFIHMVSSGGDEVLYCRQITHAGRPLELSHRFIRDEVFVHLVIKAPIAQAAGPQTPIPVWLLRGIRCLGIIIDVLQHDRDLRPPRPVLPSFTLPFATHLFPNPTLKLKHTHTNITTMSQEHPARAGQWFSLSRIPFVA